MFTTREGRNVVALDPVLGGTLAHAVTTGGAFTSEELVTVIVPLVSALDRLHGSGAAHTHVSPGSILFTGDGRPLLEDPRVPELLGTTPQIACQAVAFEDPVLRSLRRSGAPLPPPVLQAADRWALAACAWFALTSTVPAAPDDRSRGAAGQVDGLRQVLLRCLSPDPRLRPVADEFADLVWQSARAAPIRRLPVPTSMNSAPGTGSPRLSPGPPDGQADADPAGSPGRAGEGTLFSRPVFSPQVGHRSKSGGSTCRTIASPVSRWVLLLLAVGVAGALTAAAGWRTLRWPGEQKQMAHSRQTSVESGQSALATDTDRSTDQVIRAGPALRVELAEALVRIGKARANAFALVSSGPLREADVPGSAALRADLALLERLRRSGHRLEDLRYRVTDVRARPIGRGTVRVRALVSTSAHRQVQVGRGTATGVPATGPSDLVFVLRASEEGAVGRYRWRVLDVRAGR